MDESSYDMEGRAPLTRADRVKFPPRRRPCASGSARPLYRQSGTAFEVWLEGGGARLAREVAYLPKVGARLGAGKGAARVEGVVTRIVPGELPGEDSPGRITRVYLAPDGGTGR